MKSSQWMMFGHVQVNSGAAEPLSPQASASTSQASARMSAFYCTLNYQWINTCITYVLYSFLFFI